MSNADYFANVARRCPLCSGQRTQFCESYSDGEEIVELPVSQQKCSKCGLPCKLWERIGKRFLAADELCAAVDGSTEAEAAKLEAYKRSQQ